MSRVVVGWLVGSVGNLAVLPLRVWPGWDREGVTLKQTGTRVDFFNSRTGYVCSQNVLKKFLLLIFFYQFK